MYRSDRLLNKAVVLWGQIPGYITKKRGVLTSNFQIYLIMNFRKHRFVPNKRDALLIIPLSLLLTIACNAMVMVIFGGNLPHIMVLTVTNNLFFSSNKSFSGFQVNVKMTFKEHQEILTIKCITWP